MYRMLPFFFLAVSFVVWFACNPPQESESTLGEVEISFQSNQPALEAFEKGLLLLHNFEYDDARTAFLEAQEADPNFAMAYWGEAMTHNHPLWRQQAYEEGRAALNKLAETPEARAEKAGTELERDFLKSVELLYGEGQKNERDQAYSDFLKDLYEKYPGNQEVASFYALSILGAVPVGRDMEAYEQGAQVVQAVLEKNPKHPGALHYLIHSYDDPVRAHLALDAANKYSKVAKDAVHALHMPSHIFLAVGMWKEVVASNIDSWEASVRRKEAQGLDNDALSYYALHWLQYGHLQLGQTEAARKIMDDMIGYTQELPSKSARRYFLSMRGAYLLETGDWEHPVYQTTVAMDDIGIDVFGKYAYTNGQYAYLQKDKKALAAIIDTLDSAIESSGRQVGEGGLPMCSSGSASTYKVTQLDIDQAKVMLFELQALQAMLETNPEEAEARLQAAVELEEGLHYGYGPPVILQPSHELYAVWLQEQGRQEEAKTFLEKSLERAPKRKPALDALEATPAKI